MLKRPRTHAPTGHPLHHVLDRLNNKKEILSLTDPLRLFPMVTVKKPMRLQYITVGKRLRPLGLPIIT